MRVLLNRNELRIRNRCIRHGGVALMAGARFIPSCAISPAQPEPKRFKRLPAVFTQVTQFLSVVDERSTLSGPYS